MSDNVKKWLRLSIFNSLIFILVSTIMMVTSFLNNTPAGVITKIIMGLISSAEGVCTYICWERFLLKKFQEGYNDKYNI